jgi:hypothetical protein
MTPDGVQARPTDPLSIVALAAGIGALVLALLSVLPLMAMCFGPISALSALVGLVTGLASVIRTSVNRELDGRLQALTGLGLSLVWVMLAGGLALYATRH